MIDLKKPRYLVKDRLTGRVDKNEHEEKPCDYCYMKNGCAMNPSDCWELDIYLKLKSFENAIESGELVQVVRCGECVWWRDRQVKLSDGTYRDYKPDEPWSVTTDVGINIGSHCTKHGFENASGSWFWTNENDYCSRGTKLDGKDGDENEAD